jgi:hypothetical protein
MVEQTELDFSPQAEEPIVEKPKTKITVSMDDMTFGEMELFEDVTGLVMTEAIRTVIVTDPKTGRALPDPEDPKGRPLKETRMSVKAMMGMVFVAMHRDNADLTFSDIRNMKMSDIDLEMTEADDSEGKDD